MKTKFLILTLLLISATTFAQKFTQATLNDILAEYKTNSKTFFTSRLSDDFRYTTRNGAYQTRKDILGGEPQKILRTEIAEPVIFQSGDLAVVSGIHRTERTGSDGNPVMGQVACTYTFQRRANKWMFVASQQSNMTNSLPSSASADTAAIKAVLEGHTQATIDRNVAKAISYLADSPDVAVALADPGYPRGYDAVAESYRKSLGSVPKDNSQLMTHGYRFRIMGNAAFVTYREIMTKPDGTVKIYDKANYLENKNGQWKIVGNFWMPEQK